MKHQSNHYFSIIFACYNEQDELKDTVEYTDKILSALFVRHQIIIVNDASIDKSGEIANTLAKKYSSVSVIHNPINLGQGISFLIGLTKARGDLVMQNGVDRPFDVADIAKLIHYFPKYDIVAVARKDRSAYTLWRKLTSHANNIFRRFFFGNIALDLNFVQVYKRSIINIASIQSRSAAFVTQELVIRLLRQGYMLKEVVLPYHRRKTGVANHGKKRDILWALIDLFNFWLDLKSEKKA